ncbi:RadC family protein [Fusibacter bizertensis]
MIKNLPYEEQPREKLVTYGASFLSNSELLAILLRTGTRNKSAVDLGRLIVNKFGNNINELSQVTIEELCTIDGIGESKATQIISAIELGKRVKQSTALRGLKITSPSDVVKFFSTELSDSNVEKFAIVLLNTKNEVINWEIISIGSLNASIVHPREVFNRAIKRSAASIIAIHNHPSGAIEPSREDLSITKRLSESGQLIGIPLIDHIIIGKSCYYSFKEQNQL